MDEKEKKPAPEGSSEQPKPIKKLNTGKILFYAIIAGAVVFNTIVAFVLIQTTRPKDVAEKETEAKADSLKRSQGRSTEIGSVSGPVEAVVNIAGTNGERFLKVVVKFEYDEKKYPKMAEEMKRFEPKLKDVLIEIISPLTLTELNEPETRVKLRQDMLRDANNALPPDACQMRDVFIDQFIIQ
jgi:flagellar FliL protein